MTYRDGNTGHVDATRKRQAYERQQFDEAKAAQQKGRQDARERAQRADRHAGSARGMGYNEADKRNMSRDDRANMMADVNRTRRDQGEARLEERRAKSARTKETFDKQKQWGLNNKQATNWSYSPKESRYINEGGEAPGGGDYQRRSFDKLRHQQSRREADDRMQAANIADPDKNVTAEDYEQYKAGKAHWQESATNAYDNYMNNMQGGGGRRAGGGKYFNPYTNSYE